MAKKKRKRKRKRPLLHDNGEYTRLYKRNDPTILPPSKRFIERRDGYRANRYPLFATRGRPPFQTDYTGEQILFVRAMTEDEKKDR